MKQVLSTHYPDHLDAQTDAAIRAKFPIRLLSPNFS